MIKKVVIIGGPSTGKSAIVNELMARGFSCFEEVSRQVTLNAQKQGISQLFLEDPLLFSDLLLKGRQQQYNDALKLTDELVFFDRGIPDVVAYMDFIGTDYPKYFSDACKNAVYDAVFMLKPWKAIYTTDNERYESFEQALEIHENLTKTYEKYNYTLIDVPFDSVTHRTDFILNTLGL
ncbi:MAG: AAA family ATPase [Aestuariibaculum sp.]